MRKPGVPDDDRGWDRLLRDTLEQTRPASACEEAETLAAWSAGGLPATETAAIERHVSECPRCQAVVAAMMRAAAVEPVGADILPLPRRSRLRWFAPLAAAAAGLLIWVTVDRMTNPSQPQLARIESPAAPISTANEAVPASPPAPAQELLAEPAASSVPTGPASADTQSRPETLANADDGSRPARDQAGRLSPADATAAAGATAAREREERGMLDRLAPLEAAARTPPTAPATAQAAIEGETAAAAAPMPPAPAGPAAGATGAATSDAGRAEPARPSARGDSRSDAALALAGEPAAPVRVRSPDGVERWRIQPDGRVDQASSNGTPGAAVELPPDTTIVAGSAPSSTVVWLVGRSGVVLVRDDDGPFRRVPFPEPANLTAITATSSTSAVVTTADGRVYATTDGATWRLR